MPGASGRRLTAYAIASVATAAALLAVFYFALLLTADRSRAAPAIASADRSVLLVLPFVPMTPGDADPAFGIGLADSIIMRLSRVPGMTVRPLSASLSATAGTSDPAVAAQRARAGAALVGRYRQSDNVIKLTAQVLDAEHGFVIWARDLETSVEGLIPAEEALAAAAATALAPGPIAGTDFTTGTRLGSNATAHYLWLLAQGKLATGQSGVVADAVGLLEQAVTLDPLFARAHASLAEASNSMFLTGLGEGTVWLDRGVTSARRAIYLEESDPAGHFALGQSLLMKGRSVEATRELLHALKLDPDNTPALRWVAILLNTVGMGESFPDVIGRIETLDPTMDLGWVLLRQHEREGTLDELKERLEGEVIRRRESGISIEPTAMQLGVLSYMMGEPAQGLRWAARLEQVSSNRDYMELIALLAHARLGDPAAVSRIIERNRVAYSQDWDYAGLVARALGSLGDGDGALTWLSLSATAGNCDAWGVENLSEFDGLRNDPRYLAAYGVVKGRAEGIAALLRQAGFR